MALGRSWAPLGRFGAALGAPGLVLGEPRGGPGRKWFAPGTLRGGPKEQGSDPRGVQGGPRKRKRAFWSGSGFSGGAGIVININVSAIFKKIRFSVNCIFVIPGGGQRGLRDECLAPKRPPRSLRIFWGAPLQPPRGPSKQLVQPMGGLFGGSWIG